CPGHIKIYQTHLHSYRDLPIRYTELGTVYRYEKSGTLHGLVRVRGFTQDDAHIFCTPQQLHHELVEVIKLTKFILQSFGFQKKNFEVVLSLRDPANKKKYLGNDEIWQLAETALAKALKSQGWSYQEEIGEAAFYGPKIDILVKDALGRQWQISTLQVDFNLSERFDITYIDNQGKKQRPIMLHRALLGSLERFTGLLIEHYAGAFPLWLSTVQIYLAAVGEKHHRFTQQLAQEFIDNGFRCQINNLNETISHKVRDAEKQKIPYILVIGDKEMNGRYLNIRQRREKKTTKLTKKQFIDKMKEQIAKKK
ncbi:MAG: threonine--tRNA ligase, partial [Candidatus Aenigmarchaeota archaeon]|nr:threonine--tRNA ligase [Candidatus Aenigmarchaeota archaeon]